MEKSKIIRTDQQDLARWGEWGRINYFWKLSSIIFNGFLVYHMILGMSIHMQISTTISGMSFVSGKGKKSHDLNQIHIVK